MCPTDPTDDPADPEEPTDPVVVPDFKDLGSVQSWAGDAINKPITREEMAIMAAAALKLVMDTSVDADSALAKFDDKGSIASYAKEAVALLAEEGIIQGMTDSTFVPQGQANRAQAAVIIFRIFELLEA